MRSLLPGTRREWAILEARAPKAKRWARIFFAALLLFLSLIAFREEFRFFLERDPKLAREVTEKFNDGVLQRPELLTSQGFVLGPRGWELLPHTKGRLIYKFPEAVPPGGGVFAYLWIFRPSQQVHSALKLHLAPSGILTTIAEDVRLRGDRINLTPYLPSGGAFELVFDATNDGPSAFRLVAQMKFKMFEGRPPEPPSPPRMFLGFLLCSVAIALLTPHWRRALPFALILSAAFYLRYSNLDWVVYTPLDSDAEQYRSFAEAMTLSGEHGFYSGNFSLHEPFFPLAANILFRVLGPSDTHLRLLSLVLSLGVIYLVYKQAGDLLGPGWGLAACSIVALNHPLARESVRGLRLELEMVLLLLFCQVAFVKKDLAPLPRFLLMGLLGGLAVLTRSFYLPGLALLTVYVAWRERHQVKQIVLMGSLPILLMVLVLIPHHYGMYKLYGDPFWNTRGYARWLANWEFAGRPGFPSRAELERNSDRLIGPKMTLAQYLFQLHTPAQVLISSLKGFTQIIARMNVVGLTMVIPPLGRPLLEFVDPVVTALGVIGFFIALCSAEFRWLPVAYFALTFHASFLYDRGLLEAYRHTLQGFPFFLMCGLLAVRKAPARAAPKALRALTSRWMGRCRRASS